MRTFTPMQNAEEECGIREKREEASWRWVPGAELSGEDGEAVSGCRMQPQRSPLLRHSSSAFCIGVKFRIPHSSRPSPLFHSKAPGLRDGLYSVGCRPRSDSYRLTAVS